MGVVDGMARWTADPGTGPPLRAQTTGDLLDAAAQRWPARDAVVAPPARWSFAALRERARGAGRALIASGIGPGDRVAVWATNLPDWIALQFGAAYSGAVLVPLNPLYRLTEASDVLARSGASALFVLPEHRGASLWDLAFEATEDVPVVAFGDAPDARGAGYDDWIATGESVPDAELFARSAAVAASDPVQIQFTSGTTGAPKGVVLSHGGLVNNARLCWHRAGLRRPVRFCSALPFFHCGGSAMSTLGAIATGSAFFPQVSFDAPRMVAAIEEAGVEAILAVPTMLFALERALDDRAATFSSLRTVIVGGSVVPHDLCARWQQRFGVRFSIVYGLTEASPVITQSAPSDPPDRQFGSCGRALDHVEWEIAGPAGATGALGEPGEVRVRGWSVMAGYHGDAQGTAAVLDPDGWLRTGDLGTMDADGYLRITGRAKDLIIRGGENIDPAEVEAALRELPEVAEAYVVGAPDDEYGEVVAAFVQLHPGTRIELASVVERLAPRLARFKLPRSLDIVDEWPLTPSGKVQKFRLEARLRAAVDVAP